MRFLLIAIAAMFAASISQAGIIGSAYSDAIDADGVSFEFTIDQSTSDPLSYRAEVANTSPTQDPESLIDAIAFGFNPYADLGVDVSFLDPTPLWTFSESSGGIRLDYVGDSATPGTRLGIGQSLIFDINFQLDYWTPATLAGTEPYRMFLTSSEEAGTGIGGGDVSGQVAVSFQQLGETGNDSELLMANWADAASGPMVPEPSSAMFALVGICCMAMRRGKRK